LPGGITLSRQTQIDSFPLNYPGCTGIEGFVIVSESVSGDITNLDSLAQITTINENCYIQYNSALLDLQGLSGLTSVGYLRITSNAALISLEGINALRNSNQVEITNNDLLVDLTALSNLDTVAATIYIYSNFSLPSISGWDSLKTVGALQIENNGSLTDITLPNSLSEIQTIGISNNHQLISISGLQDLDTLTNLYIGHNTLLTSINAFSNIAYVAQNITITNCPALPDLLGFSGLNRVDGSMYILNNNSITDLTGLENFISATNGFTIYNNNALLSLNGLSSSLMAGLYVEISWNQNLLDIDDFEHVDISTITQLTISGNSNLTFCTYDNICSYVLSGQPFNIAYNGGNCADLSFQCLREAIWIGETGDWNIASNWDIGMVPDDSTRVVIPQGMAIIPDGFAAGAATITLNGGGQLEVDTLGELSINLPFSNNALDMSQGAQLTNHGVLRIGNLRPVSSYGISISSGSVMTNSSTGSIFIDSLDNIYKGAVAIDGIGSSVSNSGSITIGLNAKVEGSAFSVWNQASLINLENASIEVLYAVYGISVSGAGTEVSNSGEIKIENRILDNSSAFTVTTSASLVNTTTGLLQIDNYLNAVWLSGSGALLTNHGIIDFGSVQAITGYGIRVENGSDAVNAVGGLLKVNRTLNAVHVFGSGSTIENYGTWEIGSDAACSNGITLGSSGVFSNQSGGLLQIDRISVNHGIQGLTSSVFNNSGTIHIGSIDNINKLGINLATSADFNNLSGGVIDINRCLTDGIIVTNTGSTFINAAALHIGNLSPITSTGLAVTVSGVFTNQASGNLTINRTTGYAAIVLNGSAIFNNSGTVQLGSSDPVGGGIIMWALGKFNNLAGSTLEINRSTWTGVLVDQSGTLFTNNGIFRIGNIASIQSGIALGNGGDFINNSTGSIQVDRINDIGIQTHNSGSVFTNNGAIQAGTNGVIGNAGISVNSSSSFTNSASGSIQINNANVNWWTKAIVVSVATFTNTGFIIMGDLIQNSGGITVAEAGTFTNAATGSIQVHNTFYNGIQLYHVNTTFTNHGSVVMGGMADLGYNGIAVSENATFTNSVSGSMVINNVKVNWWSRGILLESAGKLNNSGSIQLGNTNLNNSGVFIQGAGIFTNNAGAALHINNAFYNGIELTQSGSSFVNHGSLMIGAIGNVKEMGIKLLDNATFTNSVSGLIHVNNVNTNWWSRAISITASTFNNSGTILEGNLGLNSLGVLVESTGSLINNVSGDIEINNATYHGIQINHTASSCTNHGDIKIGAELAAGHYGIVLYENGSMINSPTGTIALNMGTTNSFSGGIFVSSGAFTNSGLIKAGNISNVNYGLRIGESATLTGTFSNFGTIEVDRIGSTAYAAIYVHPNSFFSNEVSGIVKLGHLSNVLYGIYGGGTASNYGLIQTKSVQYGTVDYAQTMTNYPGGVLESLAPGTLIIETASTLHNNAGAILRSQPGGFIRIKGVVNNFGLIEAQ